MKRLIVVGSPRTDGRSASLANLLFESCIAECPDDEVYLAPVSTLDIAGCTGCDACKELAARAAEREVDDDSAVAPAGGASAGGASAAEEGRPRRCSIDDDMADLYPLIDEADELIVVAPVYFAGPSSQLKALLDRFQPYYWTEARHRRLRPATLHIVGEGGDPFGYDPLIGIVRSAAHVAGFRLVRALDWIGKIAVDGEVEEDAEEIDLSPSGAPTGSPAVQAFAGGALSEDDDAEGGRGAAGHGARPSSSGGRPRLSLGANGSQRQVIQVDETGARIDDYRGGRKRGKNAQGKRGTSGHRGKPSNPHKGGQANRKGQGGRKGQSGRGSGSAGGRGGRRG